MQVFRLERYRIRSLSDRTLYNALRPLALNANKQPLEAVQFANGRRTISPNFLKCPDELQNNRRLGNGMMAVQPFGKTICLFVRYFLVIQD